MQKKGLWYYGVETDPQTRCKHYNSERDIIAIKFKCCGLYFCCYECHQELVDHRPAVWKKEDFGEKAVLCGACGEQLTIGGYLGSDAICPGCNAEFNPGCANHYHLYFETEKKHG